MAQTQVRITITLGADGGINLDGPLDNPLLFIGLIEQAKLLYVAQGQGAEKEEGPRILLASAALGDRVRAR